MIEGRIGLVVFIDDQNKILLQKRTSISKFGEEWGYFGGKIEEGETPEEAAHREIKEELDYDVRTISFLGQYESVGKRLSGEMRKVVQCVFFAHITQEDFRSMELHEGDDMQWFSLEEAKELHMYPLDPQILEDLQDIIKK